MMNSNSSWTDPDPADEPDLVDPLDGVAEQIAAALAQASAIRPGDAVPVAPLPPEPPTRPFAAVAPQPSAADLGPPIAAAPQPSTADAPPPIATPVSPPAVDHVGQADLGPGAHPTPDEFGPVDQVAVRKLGGFNFLSASQWAALPRDERARLIKGGLVQFLNDGEEVPVRPALRWFQDQARADDPGFDPDDRGGTRSEHR